MALSTENAKDTLKSSQVILELAGMIKSLNDDPKHFEKLSKDAYALPDAEQKKADEARASIAKYQDLLAQHKRQAADIEASQDNLDLRTKQVTDASALIDSKTKDLAARERAFATEKAAHVLNVEKLAKDQAELSKGQERLETDREEQIDKEKAFEADKAALKDKSDKLKSLIG